MLGTYLVVLSIKAAYFGYIVSKSILFIKLSYIGLAED